MKQIVTLAKYFEVDRDEYLATNFSDVTKVTLERRQGAAYGRLKNLNTGALEVLGETPNYSVAADLYMKFDLWNPNALDSWGGFDLWGETPVGTSIGVRLSADGITHQYWNGSAWVTASAGNWNTVQEINDNIPTFTETNKKVQVIVNLKTTDKTVTPTIEAVGILYDAYIDFDYDLVFDSLMARFKQMRPRKDWAVELNADSTTVDLAVEHKVDPFDIKDVHAVYNHTNDPAHLSDILSSYNPSTKLVTLTASQDAGDNLWVIFSYQLQVVVQVHQDFGVVEKIPALIIEDIDDFETRQASGKEIIRNKALKTATAIEAPVSIDFRFTMKIMASRERDMAAIRTALVKEIEGNPLLTSYGLGEKYSMLWNKRINNMRGPNLSDLKEARMVLDILAVNWWLGGSQQQGLVTSGLTSSGDLAFTSGSV